MTIKEINDRKKPIGIANLFGILLAFVSFLLFMFNPFAVIGVIVGGIAIAVSSKLLKKLSVEFKEIYVRDALKEIIPTAEYDPKKGFDEERVYASKILKKEDRYASEDYLKGTIKGRTFESADVHLKDVRSNGKSTTVVTVFQGRFFMIDARYGFEEDVYVVPNRYWPFGAPDDLKKVELESIRFNESFDVFSKNEQSAFYLLTPLFMEKLEEFARFAQKTMFGFTQDRVYVAIDTRKDAFDLGMYKPVDSSYVDDINKEISLIEELIELLE
ncbi:MAG: DUF3137 domain-containing protein [Acholeplasmataceae bacterium]